MNQHNLLLKNQLAWEDGSVGVSVCSTSMGNWPGCPPPRKEPGRDSCVFLNAACGAGTCWSWELTDQPALRKWRPRSSLTVSISGRCSWEWQRQTLNALFWPVNMHPPQNKHHKSSQQTHKEQQLISRNGAKTLESIPSTKNKHTENKTRNKRKII